MGLRFLVGHDADATAVADVTGAFAKPRPGWAIVVYSSAALGRLVSKDVIGFIRYLRGHVPASRS